MEQRIFKADKSVTVSLMVCGYLVVAIVLVWVACEWVAFNQMRGTLLVLMPMLTFGFGFYLIALGRHSTVIVTVNDKGMIFHEDDKKAEHWKVSWEKCHSMKYNPVSFWRTIHDKDGEEVFKYPAMYADKDVLLSIIEDKIKENIN